MKWEKIKIGSVIIKTDGVQPMGISSGYEYKDKDYSMHLTFGGGYDFSLNKNLAITPFINYSFWKTDDQDHNAWTLGIGFTMQ